MQPLLDSLDLAGNQQCPGKGNAEHRPDPDHVVGEFLEPATHHGLLPGPAHGRDRQLDQVRRPPEISGGQRVADGQGPLAVLLVPRARPPVQLRHLAGLLVEQPRLQHVSKQVVVAIPPAAVIQRDQKQVPPVQRLQHGLAAALPGDRIAQRAAQPAQDGGLQQEGLDPVGLALQHLLGQVVDDVTIIAREAGNEAGDVLSPLHRQRRQLQRGDPALGAGLQHGHVPRRQLQAHHPVEVRRRLIRGEAQLGRANLGQLAARPQPGQRQRRIGPAGDHHMQPRRQMVEQERHPVLHLACVDDVVVIEHQHDVARDRGQVVEQRRQHRFDRRRLRRPQKCQRTLAYPGCHRPQCGDHIGPEGRRIVVAPIE